MRSKQKVLCVDDEPINLLILKRFLAKEYEVIAAESGHEALLALKEDQEIKLIISDLRMPGMSGMEFIKEAQKSFKNLKCFILSSYPINEEIQQALNDKIILAYFQKPANASLIIQSLQKHS
jgi:CheY-like chemotaxis protein